jgi:hypothetical protein
VVRAGLDNLLDNRGLERLDRDHAGSLTRLTDLPATDLQGVSLRSTLGKKLADTVVADIAGQSQADFVGSMVSDISDTTERARVERQAGQLWRTASRVNKLSSAWRD